MNKSFLHASIRDSSSAEIQALDEICEQLGGFDERVNLEWVDGFLTALAATPAEMASEVWLPAMLGDSFERVFADPADHARALKALQTRLKVLGDQLDPDALLDAPDQIRLAPLMLSWDDAAKAEAVAAALAAEPEQPAPTAQDLDLMQTGIDWALGFLDATQAFAECWDAEWPEEPAQLREQLLLHVDVLLMEAGSEERSEALQSLYGPLEEAPADGAPSVRAEVDEVPANPDPEPERDELIADALAAVQELRVLLLDQAPRAATRRVAVMPGRNEPCHCGSGKKFKKCHGA